MIYFLSFFLIAIIADFKYLESINKKGNIVFYVCFMLVALTLGVFYYTNTSCSGIAEFVIGITNLEVR